MTWLARPPFAHADDWDDALERDEAAVQCIADAAALVDEWLAEYSPEHLLSTKLLAEWHAFLFRDVFPQFAGRIRNQSFPREVHFSEFNGVGSRLVDNELRRYEGSVQNLISQLDDYQSASQEDFDTQVVRAAAWSHADFVRIHPFLNGNGRTGRLVIDYFAYRYNLNPVGIGRPSRSDYVSAMSFYVKYRDSANLCRFLLPLMIRPSGEPSRP